MASEKDLSVHTRARNVDKYIIPWKTDRLCVCIVV